MKCSNCSLKAEINLCERCFYNTTIENRLRKIEEDLEYQYRILDRILKVLISKIK